MINASFNEDAQTLVELGLSNSQARIYLTLISLGRANAKKIIQELKIDSGEVYRQLEALCEKSLVEKVLSFPNEYKPMPLENAIRMLVDQKNKESAEILQKAKLLLRKRHNTAEEKEYETQVSIIPQNEYRKRYGTKIIDVAEKEILWYSQIQRLPVTGVFYYEANKKALARGVRWRSIAELDKPTENILKYIEGYKNEFPGWEVRFVRPTLFVTFVLYDDKELNFSIENVAGLADSQILRTNNPQLIKVIKDYFELRWTSAMTEFPKEKVIDA